MYRYNGNSIKLVWKADMDMMLTLMGFAKRNISVSSLACRFCGERGETSNYHLISCNLANLIWKFVDGWCQIPPVFAFLVRDLLKIHESSNVGQKKKKVIHGIILTTWCIW